MNSSNTTIADGSTTVDPTDPAEMAMDAAAIVEDADNSANDGDVETSEAAVWSRFGDGPLPALPKTAAVNRAYRAAVDFGLPEGFASALAHVVVDPAALRAALNNPTRINLAGGMAEVIDVDLYTPGLVPLPTNNRTMDMRVYPAGGVTGHLGPLIRPRSEPGKTSRLWIEAQSVQHALDEAKQAQDYILVKNPLKDSVAARGIVMPVTVVYFELRHRDGQPAMPLLGTADGSSRITGAHAVLNLVDPRTTHYDLPANRDLYRRFVDNISSPDIAPLGVTAARRLRWQRNALITPARIFLRFTPPLGAAYDFGRAVAAYVGMLHVDPPRPWTPTGKLEAMAEAVLEVLRSASVLDDTRHDYLAGLLTPEAAAAAGLPTQRDEQAAHVLATLLQPDLRDLVDRGIMDVTAKKSVTANRRSDVVAELALRPTRSAAVILPPGDPARERANAMRAAYLRATHLSAYTARRWAVTGRSPDELLAGALAELGRPEAEQENPDAWRDRLELAALAQYHLTAYEALKRDPMLNREADQRSPQEILGLMLQDQRGLRLLRQAVVDGRAGVAPRLVDVDGQITHGVLDDERDVQLDPDGLAVPLTDRWLRYDGFPSGGPTIRPVSIRSETPTMKASRLQQHILYVIEQMAKNLDELDHLEAPAGGALLDQRGWPASDTKNAVEMLIDAQSKFGYWGQVAARQAIRVDQLTDSEIDEEFDEEVLAAPAAEQDK
ncbi:MAG TPA: hypothetical protein VHY21_13115 [Pseudonocardiaceae bacterium]|jgi:hypothetical protein|nr:hypothetical protein [Pseudonocardiaceae bacterium]